MPEGFKHFHGRFGSLYSSISSIIGDKSTQNNERLGRIRRTGDPRARGASVAHPVESSPRDRKERDAKRFLARPRAFRFRRIGSAPPQGTVAGKYCGQADSADQQFDYRRHRSSGSKETASEGYHSQGQAQQDRRAHGDWAALD